MPLSETLEDVHKSLPQDVRDHLVTRPEGEHKGILEKMRNMVPTDRIKYGQQIMAPAKMGTINKNQNQQLKELDALP